MDSVILKFGNIRWNSKHKTTDLFLLEEFLEFLTSECGYMSPEHLAANGILVGDHADQLSTSSKISEDVIARMKSNYAKLKSQSKNQ